MKTTPEQINFIRDAFQKIKSKEDLVALLNYAKPILYGKEAKLFEVKHLNYHSSPKANARRYNSFDIRKKSGGVRIIHAPNSGLKSMLRCVNLILQATYEPHGAATGFVPGKSIVDNAKVHAGSLYVYNIDLKDFFPSIDQARVWKRLQLPPFNLNDKTGRLKLANMIAGLCCHEMEVERLSKNNEWGKEVRNVLPQGAPTSPTITNIICERLDFYLTAVAKRFGLKYSRYADDITFSSMHNVYQEASEFMLELNRIISEQNFHVQQSKVRLQRSGYRQEVTGLVVNQNVNVRKRYIKDIRKWLYLWEHYGYVQAEQIFLRDYIGLRKHLMKGKPNMANVIGGKLDYLKMVKGDEFEGFKKLKIRFDELNEVPKKSEGSFSELTTEQIDILPEKAQLPQPVDERKQNWITPAEYYKEISSLTTDIRVIKDFQKAFEQVYHLTEGFYEYLKPEGDVISKFNLSIIEGKFCVTDYEFVGTDNLPESLKTEPNFESRLNSIVSYDGIGVPRSEQMVSLAILENFDKGFGGIFKKISESKEEKSTLKISIKPVGNITKLVLASDLKVRKGTEIPIELPNDVPGKLENSNSHNPQNTVELLRLFGTKGHVFKDSSHGWSLGEYESYEAFLKCLLDEWKLQKRKMINAKIWAKVNSFFAEKYFTSNNDPGKSVKVGWSKYYIPFGWSSTELGEEAKKFPNRNIDELELPERRKVIIGDDRRLEKFGDVRDFFQHQIEFRDDNKQLYQLVDNLRRRILKRDIEIAISDMDQLKGISFYTDTEKIEDGLEIIFKSFIQGVRTTYNTVTISINQQLNDNGFDDQFVELMFCQIGSFSDRDVNHPKLKGSDKGDFGKLQEIFKNLCDWSIESKFRDGKCYRINYLSQYDTEFIENISDASKVKGFTHILRFYL